MRKRRRNRPSYTQGFARRKAEAAYPGLWDGLVFNWHGPLGPTGLKAKDTSGYGNDGTLTNMEPDTDWLSTSLGPALDFGGTDEYIALTSFVLQPYFSVQVWYKTLDAGVGTQPFMGSAQDGMWVNWEYPTYAYIRVASDRNMNTGVNGCDGNWHQDLWTVTPDVGGAGFTATIYRDGIYRGIGTTTYGGADFQVDTFGKRGTTYGIVTIASIAMWQRVLLANEIQLLYVDPHAIVRPKQQVFFSVGGVSTFSLSSIFNFPTEQLGNSDIKRNLRMDWKSVFGHDNLISSDWTQFITQNGGFGVSFSRDTVGELINNVGWLGNLYIDKNIETEWTSEGVQYDTSTFRNLFVEWVSEQSKENHINTEWLAQSFPIIEINAEYIREIATNKTNAIEWLKQHIYDKTIPVEWLLDIPQFATATQRNIFVDWTQFVETSKSLEHEWFFDALGTIQRQLPLEWIQSLSQESEISSDWLYNQIKDNDIKIGWTLSQQNKQDIPVEWTSPTSTFSTDRAIPIGFGFTLNSPLVIPIEFDGIKLPISGIWILNTRPTTWTLSTRPTTWTLSTR